MTWMQSTEFEVLSGQWHEFNIWFSQHLNLGLNRVFWLVDSSECWCLIGQEGQLKIFKAVTLKILKFPYLYHKYCICVINYRSMKAFGQCRRWFWSMTLRHAFVSLTMDIDTNVCIHVIDHWSMTRMLLVNDTDACIRVIDRSQWHGCVHSCHWPWSMTRMRAFVSLTTGQWHECLHSCHWPVSLTGFILRWDSISPHTPKGG